MNLAPIEVTGGSDNQDYFQSLPDLFKANVPATDCTTPEMSDPTIPNPGKFLVRASTYKPGAVTGPKCEAASPDGSSDTGSGSGSGGASSAAGGYSQPAASSAQPSSAPTADDGQYHQPAASSAQPTSTAAGSSAAPSATVPASSASSAAPPSTFSTHTVLTSSATAPTYTTLSPILGHGVSGPSTGTAPPTGSPSSSSGSSSSGSSSSGSVGSSGQCSTEGAIVCNGPNQFGLCDHGSVVWQSTAAGTQCSEGAILKRSLPRRHARSFHKVRV